MTLVPDGTIETSDHAIGVTAGEDLAVRDAVYIDPSDGEAYKCDADDLAKIAFVGFVVEAATNGNTVYIKPHGHMGGFTGLTAGEIVYVSTTAGGVTQTKPTNFKVIGKALTSTIIEITKAPTIRVREYTADATWTKPAGLIKVLVKVQAAGGGSGVANNSFSCSGAGGGYTEGWLYADELGATETVTVGVGGAGGVVGGTTTGQDGEDSSFGTHLVADGGGGSVSNGSSANGGGVTTAGHFSMDGGDGNNAYQNDDGSSAAGWNMPCPGLGYLSTWTAEVRETGDDRDYEGPHATGYGYGGAIVGQDSQPSDYRGVDGGDGIVIVEEHY